jgi:hypothetical protein
MESSTVVSFTLSEPMTLKLYFGGSTAAGSKKVKIDDADKTTAADGTLTVTLNAGAHTVKKGDSINLFYISLTR